MKSRHDGEQTGGASVWIIAALFLTEMAVNFESSMIYAALPKLIRAFGDPVQAGWLVTAHMLISAATAPVAGRLGDIHGRKRIIMVLLGIALGGSLLSAVSTSFTLVLAGRALQGLSSAVIPLSIGVLRESLPSRRVPFGVGLLTAAQSAGAALGLFFPVCECGVVPVARRLYEKGLPTSIGVAFLLAAPVVNPVVIVSTYAAFGWGPVLWARVGFSFLVATVVGLIFHLAQAREILLPRISDAHAHACDHHGHAHSEHDSTLAKPKLGVRLQQALNTAGDDFLDMARYLILGAMLAAAMQTLVPQSALLAVGRGSILSVIAMQALAFVLSICSTVDAFLALAFSGAFTTGSIVTFLTFGPMVDIKSALMFLGVFQRRVVLYLIILPLLLTLLIGVFWNLNIGL